MVRSSKNRRCWAVTASLAATFLLSPEGIAFAEAIRPWSEIKLESHDRILILAPHPDDEILGCGGIIQQSIAMRLPLHVVFLTYGDSNEGSFLIYRKHPVLMPGAVRQMGLLRRDEAIRAAEIMGLSKDQLTFLGYPDYGTLEIWSSHWDNRPPLQSLLTRVKKVPYQNALHFGAEYKGEEILGDIKRVIREFRPTKIFVSHPADHHPDHRALYLFTQIALWDVRMEVPPEIYPYLIHYKGWPKPTGKKDSPWLEPPPAFVRQIAWKAYFLSPEQIDRKRSSLKAHATQYRLTPAAFLSFVRANELFGDFPVVSLRAENSSSSFSGGDKGGIEEGPERLTDEERAFFVGAEWRTAQLEGDHLVLSIDLSRPLAKEVGVSLYVFGYQTRRPFQKMPKLHVKLGLFRYEVYDQNQRLPPQLVRVVRAPKQITLRVPLEVVGYPERILTSAQTYFGEIPLDWVSWRILELPEPS